MKTADLFDSNENLVTVCATQFISYGKPDSCFGRIATVKCFEDNSLVKKTLATDGEGRVLVVDGGSSVRNALMGDIIAQSAVDNGWRGVVILGAIRDSCEIGNLPLHVKALGTNPQKSTKLDLGQKDIPVHFGNAAFVPGYWIYSDKDGILVSPKQLEI